VEQNVSELEAALEWLESTHGPNAEISSEVSGPLNLGTVPPLAISDRDSAGISKIEMTQTYLRGTEISGQCSRLLDTTTAPWLTTSSSGTGGLSGLLPASEVLGMAALKLPAETAWKAVGSKSIYTGSADETSVRSNFTSDVEKTVASMKGPSLSDIVAQQALELEISATTPMLEVRGAEVQNEEQGLEPKGHE